MKDFQLHNIRFYDYKPLTINNLAYDATTDRIAASYSDASLRIFSVPDKFYAEKMFPGCLFDSIEAIVWLNGRLFVTGLTGFVHELDIINLCIKTSVPTYSEGSWCMVSDGTKSKLAVGTEAGSVVIYSTEEELTLSEMLSKLTGRILTIAWCPLRGHLLATGGEGQVCIWDMRHRRALRRLRLDRRCRGRPVVVVWSLVFVPSGELLSADSEGRVIVWEPEAGGELARFQIHCADVLALSVAPQGNAVWAASVDPVLLCLERLSNGRWLAARQVHGPTHDVRALCCTSKLVVAGGHQARLMTYSLDRKQGSSTDRDNSDAFWLPWIPQNPVLSSAVTSDHVRLALLHYPNRLELVQLPTPLNKPKANISRSLTSPSVLANILPRKDDVLLCSALECAGRYIALSDTKCTRLMRFFFNSSRLQAVQLGQVESRTVARALAFTISSSQVCLFAITLDGFLIMWQQSVSPAATADQLDGEEMWPVLRHFIPGVVGLASRPHLLSVNSDYVAVGCHDGHVLVYSTTIKAVADMAHGIADDEEALSVVPRRKSGVQPTAIALHSTKKRLFVVYSDKGLLEWDLTNFTELTWSRQFCKQMPLDWTRMSHVMQAAYCCDAIILRTNERLISLRPKLGMPRGKMASIFTSRAMTTTDQILTPPTKKRKRDNDAAEDVNDDGVVANSAIQFTKGKEHFLDFGHLKRFELVAVTMPTSHYLAKLPVPLKKKKFGL